MEKRKAGRPKAEIDWDKVGKMVIIYGIRPIGGECFYIGSTKKTPCERLRENRNGLRLYV